MNTKLQLLVRRAKLKFARVLFLKSFYRTTVIKNIKNPKIAQSTLIALENIINFEGMTYFMSVLNH
jgi:hypothetical protein